MKYVIATSRIWYEFLSDSLRDKLNKEVILINKKDDLNLDFLALHKPRYIFFPHWSYIIPKEVYDNFECVIFHMTDVPFGRGGSPLQNLVARGIYDTQVTALQCVKELDAGPVYLKKDFSLLGTAEEIYMRLAQLIEPMIEFIIQNEPIPIKQSGKVTAFKRRRPEESNIAELQTLTEIFDYIRMLDADGYPRAFLETEYFRLEFEQPVLKYSMVKANVKIIMKNKKYEE